MPQSETVHVQVPKVINLKSGQNDSDRPTTQQRQNRVLTRPLTVTNASHVSPPMQTQYGSPVSNTAYDSHLQTSQQTMQRLRHQPLLPYGTSRVASHWLQPVASPSEVLTSGGWQRNKCSLETHCNTLSTVLPGLTSPKLGHCQTKTGAHSGCKPLAAMPAACECGTHGILHHSNAQFNSSSTQKALS